MSGGRDDNASADDAATDEIWVSSRPIESYRGETVKTPSFRQGTGKLVTMLDPFSVFLWSGGSGKARLAKSFK